MSFTLGSEQHHATQSREDDAQVSKYPGAPKRKICICVKNLGLILASIACRPGTATAIPYARATPIQRSRGHSTIRRLAYNTRSLLNSKRTGERFDFRGRSDLVASMTLMPAGVEAVDDAQVLWEAIEAASKRKDAALGFELVLALPKPTELPIETSARLAEDFVKRVIVDRHQLPATICVHAPHADLSVDEAAEEAWGEHGGDSFADLISTSTYNLHAHVLVSPRRFTTEGPTRKRYTALDPVNRAGLVTGRNWGRLWHHFQNQFFAEEGLSLRVTPNPPIPLDPVPLQVVRRWRRRIGNLPDGGRDRLVNAEREHENQQLVRTIDAAMACLHAPFTRVELKSLFARHVSDDLAEELVSAAIGLGDCHQISVPNSAIEWFASTYQVQRELSVFGKAVLLDARSDGRRDVSSIVSEGFTSETRQLLTQLFDAPDLTIVKASGAVETLVADMAWVAERAGLVPISIANAAGHKIPKSVVRSPHSLRSTMASGGILLVDDPDCLELSELQLVFAAALAGGNKLVLIRRKDSDWQRLELLDLLEAHAPVLEWRSAHTHAHSPVARKAYAPRSAIVYPLAGHSKAARPGLPEFAVGPMGDIVTAPDQIATVTAFLSTSPDELQWNHSSFPGDDDHCELTHQLGALLNIENEPDQEWLSALEIEEAAFAQLERGLDQSELNDFEDDAGAERPEMDAEDFDVEPDDRESYQESSNESERDI